jgi:DNA-binding FrmR family transcriptional regulator
MAAARARRADARTCLLSQQSQREAAPTRPHQGQESHNYCIDILTQVSAATKALHSVAIGLLEEHMAHCVVQAAAAGGEEARLKIKEASDAIARLVRS